MPSYAEMVEETVGLLNDWTGQQPQMCSLTAPMTTGDLTLAVDDAERLGMGLVEVDEELVHVSSIDTAGQTGTIPPWGRAQQGSVAAAHDVGARVTTSPRPPRHRVKTRINQVIRGLYPTLWAVAADEQTADVREEYPLPAGAKWIIDVRWQTPSSPQTWERVRSWRLNTQADPTDFPTGVALSVAQVPLGQLIRTVYAAEPAPLVNPGDDFAAVTGLHAGVAELVVLAAAAHIVLGQELSRAQLATVEQSQRAEKVSTGASMAASRFLRQEFALRISDERRRLLTTHPSRPHYEGV